MSATPDLDALAARVAEAQRKARIASRLARRGAWEQPYHVDTHGTLALADYLEDTAALLRDLLTYATTARQERDEARADCKNFWKLRAELAERQVASLTAQLAEARKDAGPRA